jgi:hypothetical protein
VALAALAIANHQPYQINEALFEITLNIKVDSDGRGWKYWCPEHINGLVTNCQSMQCVVAHPERCIGALAAAPGTKGVRELSEGKHTLAGVSLDGFFANTPQKAQIILPDSLVTTAIAELADIAMAIQLQLRRAFGSLQALASEQPIDGGKR